MAVRRMLIAGRYRLHEPVGTGGMGRVWMARDEMLDRDVAVKEFVPPEWMTDPEKNRLRDRTLREARSAARLNHPHVVRIYDVVHADDLPWIVMEYVPSRSLYQVIGEDGPYSPVETARVGLAILDALSAAHGAGVLHRDVKPHNVLIGHDGRVVLTDFGLATFVDDGMVTSPGLVVGSPQYVSPERARDGASTVESDLWSLGATLYAAVEGRSPYARESAMATLMALGSEPPDPTVLAGRLAPVLEGLLRREPADRLTADEAEDGLRAVLIEQRPPLPAPRRSTEAAVYEPGAARAAYSGPDVAVESIPLPPATAIRRANQAPAAAGRLPIARSAPVSPAPAAPPAPAPVIVEDVAAAPPRRRGRRARLLVTATIVVALLAVTVGYGIWQSRRGGEETQALPSAPAAAPLAGNFTPSVCGGDPSPGLPVTPQPGAAHAIGNLAVMEGYSYFTDPSGFHMAVPDGWTYERIGTTICFRDPHSVHFLSVDTARNPAGDPVKACQTQSQKLVAAGALPGYKLEALRQATLQEKAADWEFQYQGPNSLPMHAMVWWVARDGKAFAIGWATRQFEWQPYLGTYSMLKSTFWVKHPPTR